MKRATITLLFICISMQIFSQSSIEDYVREGIQYHDSGDYDKAIEIYKKALKLDAKSTLVNYEIALSYFTKGDYDKAIEYSDIVLKQKSDFMMEAYITKGSALDVLGKTSESIKVFEKAIKQKGDHYLLYYNLGLNYYKMSELNKAEKNVIKAIELNPNHTSSHLMLSTIHSQMGNPVQSLLAAHYFLFLEPNSNRSFNAFQILQNSFGGNVSVNEDQPNTINISLKMNDNSQFASAELLISLLQGTKFLEENKGKTKDEIFVETTTSFFKILGELKTEKNKEIWWTFYIRFFYALAESEHMEAYCKYISQSGNENSRKWLSENETKLINFDTWLKNK